MIGEPAPGAAAAAGRPPLPALRGVVSALRRHPPLLAAALACLVYLPSLWGGFLYDDARVVLGSRALREPASLGALLRADPARPLLTLSLALNHALGGLRPWHYHLVNVLLHAASAALVALLLGWLARRLERPPLAATLGACVFAVSPMAAETVAYVASRSTGLAAALVLASLWRALPALERAPARAPLSSLALFLLALLAKEEAASLPLLLLLLDLFGVARGDAGTLLRRWRLHLPFLALPLVGLGGRFVATGVWLPEPALPVPRYLLTQAAAFPGYLLRALVPLDPALYRGVAPVPWPPGATGLRLACLGAGLLAAAFVWRRRRPLPAFAVLWLAAGLLPSSSVVPLEEMVVDHRAYLGSAGAALVLGALLAEHAVAALRVALIVLLALRALHVQWLLADPVRAWQDAVARAPADARAQRGLGEALAERGDPRAEAVLRRVVELAPEDAVGWSNLAALQVGQGRLEAAAQALAVAARLAPRDARVRDNLGMVLQALGRPDEALREYEAAVSGQPPLAQPRINLAALLLRRGERARARQLLDEAAALELDARDVQAIEALRGVLRRP